MENEPKIASKSKWLIPAIVVVGIIFLGLGTWAGYNHWVKSRNSQQPPQEQPKDITGFCGQSTNGPCSKNEDCMSGGCSGQVCQSKNEEPIITTCEYAECYNAAAYNLTCGCKNNQCQWK
ncbi:MAG: eight-cysteine-cluster domain-containing protein [bacterium]|nr:eight-cysteine-cluster domain-containing protein [bacterium]